jgi:hypothetical protein
MIRDMFGALDNILESSAQRQLAALENDSLAVTALAESTQKILVQPAYADLEHESNESVVIDDDDLEIISVSSGTASPHLSPKGRGATLTPSSDDSSSTRSLLPPAEITATANKVSSCSSIYCRALSSN